MEQQKLLLRKRSTDDIPINAPLGDTLLELVTQLNQLPPSELSDWELKVFPEWLDRLKTEFSFRQADRIVTSSSRLLHYDSYNYRLLAQQAKDFFFLEHPDQIQFYNLPDHYDPKTPSPKNPLPAIPAIPEVGARKHIPTDPGTSTPTQACTSPETQLAIQNLQEAVGILLHAVKRLQDSIC